MSQDYYDAKGETIRTRLLDALEIDLLGPEAPDEVLSQSPSSRYLVGMLAPKGTKLSPTEDEGTESTIDGNETGESAHRVTQQLVPSSIGISFILESNCREVDVQVSWGEYKRVDPEKAPSIDPDGDPDRTASTRHRGIDWVRIPFEVTTRLDPTKRTGQKIVADGASIEWLAEPIEDFIVVSVFLVNSRPAPPDGRPPDVDWMYQPRIAIVGNGAIFMPRRLPRTHPDPDHDIASADLIYRHRQEYAVGHGIAVNWEKEDKVSNRATKIFTTVIPKREIYGVRGPEGLPPFSMDELGRSNSFSEVQAHLSPLLNAYSDWITQRKSEVKKISPPDDSVARDLIAAQEQSLRRMQVGLECLNDQEAFEAFRFANRAMAMQRRTTERVLARRRGEAIPPDDQIPVEWRPFQIGFILQALTSLVNPSHCDREVADLLWYPTGGGKTEAYLGLTAFAFALRRLRVEDSCYDWSAGTTVLMRYTLRLLTIQQFQRALTLVCACELIRMEDIKKWGKERFTIGLWVGQSVTPNSYARSKEALQDLRDGRPVYRESPYQVLYCSWCGEDIPANQYIPDDELERTLIKCFNSDCPFGVLNSELGLPALVVDQEIYREPPSLILATVDKFALMAWNGRIKSLFGRVDRRCPRHGYLVEGEKHPRRHYATAGFPATKVERVKLPLAPPDLIIQDELHLIAGPMGSLVGIYEAVIDGLCSRESQDKYIRPKIVASTATVRRAQTQIRKLFDRYADIFPPLGIDASDSFFAVEEQEKPGRLYVGVFGPGKSVKTTLVRTYAALLSRARLEFDKVKAVDPNSHEVDVADAYMTLVGYFNSLRELGGVRRLLDDDVPGRLRVLRRRGFGPQRFLHEKDRELTSRRRSSEISDTLDALDRTFKNPQSGSYPIDVLLASNMISVGVDINRLGLMVVSAQPKTSAEYIQATSRVGRKHPGLIVEVYNWVRPRDISHYERFAHYHDTFYRHVEATSVTPFSERARDRALRGVFASYVRQEVPGLSLPDGSASSFNGAHNGVAKIQKTIIDRVHRTTDNDDFTKETEMFLSNLISEWDGLAKTDEGLVYSGWGRRTFGPRILMKAMGQESGRGEWPVATSLREVEEEVDVVLLQEEGN